MSMRNPHIALLVSVLIIFGGGFSLSSLGPTAIHVIGLVGIAAGFAVLHVLDDREFRPKRKD